MGAMTDFAGTGAHERALPSAQAAQVELAFSLSTDADARADASADASGSRGSGSHGSATVRARGELDIATADQAFAYLRDVLDSQDLGPDGALTVNLEELTFCDAAGLGVLARLAGHARESGRELKLASARPSLLRIMRITGMDRTFPELRTPGPQMIAWPRQPTAAS